MLQFTKFYPSEKLFSHNLYVMLLFALFAFLPDVVIRYFCHLPINLEILFCLGVLLFGFLLSCTNKIVFIFFALLIYVMQLIQLDFMAYFGTPIEPANLMNIFRETRDIFDPAYLKETWYIFPTLTFLFGILVFAFLRLKPVKIPFVWLILFYMAAHKPYRAFTETKDVWYFQPALTRPSLKNSVSTFAYFVFQYYPKGKQNVTVSYQPYAVKNIPSDIQNVLLIWGESLYAGHLPMYGYERNTFPQMEKILKGDNWKTAVGISGGIATATSTLLFFNTMREPANAEVLKKYSANLFKLAKQNGFHTYYLSNQESRLTMGMDVSSIDELMTNDTNPIFFNKYQDEGLVKVMQEKWQSGSRNFIVLHMRSPHSPYENRYKGREREFEKYKPAVTAKDRLTYETNTYDNALLYTDMVMAQMVKSFEKLAQGTKYSIFITADHGQLFNYQGMWGHNNLTLEQGKVPFFVKTSDMTSLPPVLPHYEVGKLIMKEIGFELHNPNEKDSIYYLHGNNIDFPYDFIEYQIQGSNLVELKRDNTGNLSKNEGDDEE